MSTNHPPVRVLVVDDHRDTCVMTGRLLIDAGHDVRTAEGSGAALAVAREWVPNVLLCDLALPDGDGCGLLAAIRALSPELRAVVVTGSGALEDRVRCARAGFQSFLLKPVDADDIVAAVQIAGAV
jgi:CheY-like chemotaxis protein